MILSSIEEDSSGDDDVESSKWRHTYYDIINIDVIDVKMEVQKKMMKVSALAFTFFLWFDWYLHGCFLIDEIGAVSISGNKVRITDLNAYILLHIIFITLFAVTIIVFDSISLMSCSAGFENTSFTFLLVLAEA